jgi:hypothetical protein
MKRKLAVLLGLAALVVLVRALVRRRSALHAAGGGDPRAEALRRKLADRRGRFQGALESASDAPGPPEPDPGETAALPDEPVVQGAADEDSASSVDEARRRVHDEARAALEDMRRASDEE